MNIALSAYDNKKILMENLCIAYRHILNKHSLYATGATGKIIEETTGLRIHKYLEGHLGGEQQLATQLAHKKIDLVIFLYDSAFIDDSEPGILGIMNLCDAHNIPLATNLATAEMLLLNLDK